jgi:uncharacterized protein with HEPN domain
VMDRRAAKELAHIQGWLDRVEQIADRGEDVYLADALLQEAGDSLMMKVGESANRLSRLGVLEPDGVDWALAVANRNFLIHQYDEIDRRLTWLTLSRDLPAWCESLRGIAGSGQEAWNRRVETASSWQQNGSKWQQTLGDWGRRGETETPSLTCGNDDVCAGQRSASHPADIAHNPEVAGSNPAPATRESAGQGPGHRKRDQALDLESQQKVSRVRPWPTTNPGERWRTVPVRAVKRECRPVAVSRGS